MTGRRYLGWYGATLFAVLSLAGCATEPSTNVHQPMSARPAPRPVAPVGNGAIYQSGYTHVALFEDRRAHNVGDTLTVLISENDSASSQNNKSETHSGSSSFTMNPNIFSSSANTGTNTSLLTSATANKAVDKGSDTNSGAFTGIITVTVTEVLPNGNLVVSGEKQVAVSNKTEYLRLSGVVNPTTITASNTVNSTQIADARVEYKGDQSIDKAQFMSMLARFFLSVAPF
ncbi:MAG TPA: flagellar biosynthesis protein FlgH [Betaproteobacteria bacterium]|nr:flagellar biosynthesis protein FlgH [Betaproteobacteria bacterium]